MKHRLKGLLALVLSLTMVLGLMTCAWGANYTVSTSPLDYGGKVYNPLQEGQLLFAGDEIMEGNPLGSGGAFVIWNGEEYVSTGMDEVFYYDSNSQKNYLDPALYCEGSYTIPSGKYFYRGFGKAYLEYNDQNTNSLSYYDTSAFGNYPVSYIHLVPVYTVTFDLQGYGTMTTATQTDIPKGDKVTEPNPAPSANGWTFGGWYKEQTCTTAWNFDTDMVTEDITLYAQWEENSGGGPSEQEPSYNFPINFIPVDPKPDETVESPKTFDGGIASAVVVTILSATGGAWLAKKKD